MATVSRIGVIETTVGGNIGTVVIGNVSRVVSVNVSMGDMVMISPRWKILEAGHMRRAGRRGRHGLQLRDGQVGRLVCGDAGGVVEGERCTARHGEGG